MGKLHQSVSCANCSPVVFSKPGMPLEIPAGQCSPVSVLDRQVLFHSFHQVPETLGKDFLLGQRLAVDQACSQFTEILLGETVSAGLQLQPSQEARPAGVSLCSLILGFASTLNFLSLEKTQALPALKSLLLWLLHCYCLAWWNPCLICGRLNPVFWSLNSTCHRKAERRRAPGWGGLNLMPGKHLGDWRQGQGSLLQPHFSKFLVLGALASTPGSPLLFCWGLRSCTQKQAAMLSGAPNHCKQPISAKDNILPVICLSLQA